SHDLIEPLRKIQTFAGIILEKEHQNLSETGNKYFQMMQNSANRMQALIKDLLAFSQITTTKRKFTKIDPNVIIEEIKDDFKERIETNNAVIKVKELCELTVIPFQFRQLLHNLISNSLK